MENGIIPPSVGRIVWYRRPSITSDPMAAIVTRVHNDRCVNLAIFMPSGGCLYSSKVPLVQPGDEPLVGSDFCEWMPFQIGQVMRMLEAEKRAAEAEEESHS